jgi:hypothetical protein
MSFSSYFSKKYKYQTQADLKNLDAEQIANILPNDVIETIDKKKVAGVTLTTPQTRAMFFLLQLKKSAKLQPSEQFRQNEITKFLRREDAKGEEAKEVDALIAKTTQEVDAENTAKLNKQIPNAPTNTPMPWPTAPTTPINVNRGGKWKKTRSEKRKRKSKSKKAKSKAKSKAKAKSKSKGRRKM